jgi:hypothetical protein
VKICPGRNHPASLDIAVQRGHTVHYGEQALHSLLQSTLFFTVVKRSSSRLLFVNKLNQIILTRASSLASWIARSAEWLHANFVRPHRRAPFIPHRKRFSFERNALDALKLLYQFTALLGLVLIVLQRCPFNDAHALCSPSAFANLRKALFLHQDHSVLPATENELWQVVVYATLPNMSMVNLSERNSFVLADFDSQSTLDVRWRAHMRSMRKGARYGVQMRQDFADFACYMFAKRYEQREELIPTQFDFFEHTRGVDFVQGIVGELVITQMIKHTCRRAN